MIIGIVQARISIDGSQSLKDKRRVVTSLKARLHRDYQVSVAEVDDLDNRQAAMIGITMATNDVRHCQSVLDKLVQRLGQTRGFVLDDYDVQILTGQ